MNVMERWEHFYDNHPHLVIVGILAIIGAGVLWANYCPSEKTPPTPGETSQQATMEQALRAAKPGDIIVGKAGMLLAVVEQPRGEFLRVRFSNSARVEDKYASALSGSSRIVQKDDSDYGVVARCFILGKAVTVDGPPSGRYTCGE